MATKLTWDFKDPDEVLDYDIDWSARMVSGDEIVGSAWQVVAGSVVIGTTANSDTATKVWLSGGTIGETCELLNRVTTQDARVMDQSVYLKIKKR